MYGDSLRKPFPVNEVESRDHSSPLPAYLHKKFLNDLPEYSSSGFVEFEEV